VLIVALLVLVATILAAIALVRSVDVATLISGNLAFRQTGVQAADSGVEVARNFLWRPPMRSGTHPGEAYFATWDAASLPRAGLRPQDVQLGRESYALATRQQ
jgi:Tfp pilus assembly protein PilX